MKPSKKILRLTAGLLAGGGMLVAASGASVDLTGRVLEADGTPVDQATVFIYTAGPKQGTSTLCPSCYADCLKRAQTDQAGQFKIEALDSTLVFRLLAVADGHEGKFVPNVDPAHGEQTISLKVIGEDALKSGRRIKGVVMDERGKAVPEAVISCEGVGLGQIQRWGGIEQMVEPLAVADENGHFVLYCKTNSVDTVSVTVDGRGVARQRATMNTGGDYLLKMPDGVTLMGQVMREGQPLPDVSIGATTKDRASGVFLNCDSVATDANGKFRLLNVPPDREFIIHTDMKSLHGAGVATNIIITTGDSGRVQDLGQLVVQPGFTLSGQVMLADNQPVPANTRIHLGREGASDGMESKLDAEGRFEFKGVPAESVSMSVRIKGYRLSKRNPSLDWLNGRILGRVNGDVKDFVILLEPGAWEFNRRDDLPGGDDDYPINKPLRAMKM